MSRALFVCGLSLLALVTGCGGNRVLDPGEPPPHGGTLVVLRDSKGVVEVVKKTGTDPITAEVSFYFFKDATRTPKTPYEPWDSMPESGVLSTARNRKVTLKVEDDALVTPTGPILYGDKEIDGELSIKVDGESMVIPLGIR